MADVHNKWQERTSFGHFIRALHSEAKRTAIYAVMSHLGFFHMSQLSQVNAEEPPDSML